MRHPLSKQIKACVDQLEQRPFFCFFCLFVDMTCGQGQTETEAVSLARSVATLRVSRSGFTKLHAKASACSLPLGSV